MVDTDRESSKKRYFSDR